VITDFIKNKMGMPDTQLPTKITPNERLMTAEQFHGLADVPPEAEWFANISNP
jgi:hypothetical protein